MLMRKLRSARVAVPIGMSLIVCGLSLNSISLLLTRMAHSLLHLGVETIDFLHGFFIGIGISLEIAGLVVMLLAVRAARQRDRAPSDAPRA